MGKRFISFLLVAVLVFGLTGCGDPVERAEFKPGFVEEKTLLKEGIKTPANNSSGVPVGSEYLEIISESGDYKYVVYST